MAKRISTKAYELVEDYLQRLIAGTHHDYYHVSATLSPGELYELKKTKAIPIERLNIERKNEWVGIIGNRGQKGTAEIIIRDISIYRHIENLRSDQGLSIEKAIDYMMSNWPKHIKDHLAIVTIREIHKKYSPFFRFVKQPTMGRGSNGKPKIIGWKNENDNPLLTFPLRDAAAYKLRSETVLTRKYPIPSPKGVLLQIHKILELPLESDIVDEIEIYRGIRDKAFNIKYINPYRLIRREDESELTQNISDHERQQRLLDAFKETLPQDNTNLNDLTVMYRQYRIIEAEANYLFADVESESQALEIDEMLMADLATIQNSPL